jgi:hypothetical protein
MGPERPAPEYGSLLFRTAMQGLIAAGVLVAASTGLTLGLFGTNPAPGGGNPPNLRFGPQADHLPDSPAQKARRR